jgi:putative peptidoglycan lipid II flippase
VQISAYVDALLASLLPTGAVAALSYAQTLYTLPVSLFGMSVSAAELPLMSAARGERNEVAVTLRGRLESGLRHIALFVLPSAVAFLAVGDVIVDAIYQTGRFTRADGVYVWGILAGAAVGLLASTFGRLYASVFYALHDTRTPLRYAMVRVVLTSALGYGCALPLPPALGIDPAWGVAGLTLSAGIAAWVEFVLLRRGLNRRIGRTGLAWAYLYRLGLAALLSAGVAWELRGMFQDLGPIPLSLMVLPTFGLVYFAASSALGITEARDLVGRAWRRPRHPR